MTYADLPDLIKRAGNLEITKLADRDRDGEIDLEVIAGALEDADNLINGYIATKYAVPLPSVPPLVRSWAVSIARYVLWNGGGAPEHVEKDYNRAVDNLKDVKRGLITLTVEQDETAPTAQSGQIMARHPEAVFTPAKLQGW